MRSRFPYSGANCSFQERVTEDPPKTEKSTNARPVLEKVVPIQVEEDPPVEEAEVITVLVPSLVRSAPTENRAKAPTKPISEQALALNVEQKQDDHASKSTTTERPSLAEPCDANDSRLVEADPPVAASGGVDREVEFEAEVEVEVRKEAAVTGAQVRRIDDNTACSLLTCNFLQGLARYGCRTRRTRFHCC